MGEEMIVLHAAKHLVGCASTAFFLTTVVGRVLLTDDALQCILSTHVRSTYKKSGIGEVFHSRITVYVRTYAAVVK